MSVQAIKTPEQQVEDLLNKAKVEITDELTKGMIKKLKTKLTERKAAAQILKNIDNDIEMMKVELAQELESINNVQ